MRFCACVYASVHLSFLYWSSISRACFTLDMTLDSSIQYASMCVFTCVWMCVCFCARACVCVCVCVCTTVCVAGVLPGHCIAGRWPWPHGRHHLRSAHCHLQAPTVSPSPFLVYVCYLLLIGERTVRNKQDMIFLSRLPQWPYGQHFHKMLFEYVIHLQAPWLTNC